MHELVIDEVFHVGWMDREMKGRNSQEGAGLSVSLDPAGWTHVAQLGGSPTYCLRREGGRFLNFNAARRDARLVKQVTDWAIDRGYIAPSPAYRLWWYDSEQEAEVYMEFTQLSDLVEEVGGEPHDGLPRARSLARDAGQRVTQAKGWQILTLALERARHTRAESIMGMDFAFLFYAEDETDLDGVWWRLTDEPDRGCIFEGRLSGWEKELLADGVQPEGFLA